MYEDISSLQRSMQTIPVQIEEVNTAASYVAGKDAYGNIVRILTDFWSPIMTIPAVGEMWQIRRRDYSWELVARLESTTSLNVSTFSDLQPGDNRIGSTNRTVVQSESETIIESQGGVTLQNGTGSVLINEDGTSIYSDGTTSIDGGEILIDGVPWDEVLEDIETATITAVILDPDSAERNKIQPTDDWPGITLRPYDEALQVQPLFNIQDFDATENRLALYHSGRIETRDELRFLGIAAVMRTDASHFGFHTLAGAAQIVRAKGLYIGPDYGHASPLEASVQFGADVWLGRTASNVLSTGTDDRLLVGTGGINTTGDLTVQGGDITLGSDTAISRSGINEVTMGNLELSASFYANDHRWDGSISFFTASSNNAQRINVKSILISTNYSDPAPSDIGIQFGPDVHLWRSSPGWLKNDDNMWIVGDLRVDGVQTQAGLLDLSNVAASTTATGAGIGDKISLWSTTYGVGVQASTLVLWVDAGGKIGFRNAAAFGQRSAGAEGVSITPGSSMIKAGATATLTGGATWAANVNVTTPGYFHGASGGFGEAFRIGDDARLVDISVSNTISIQGVQNAAIGAIRFGSAGPTISNEGGSELRTSNSWNINSSAPLFFNRNIAGTASRRIEMFFQHNTNGGAATTMYQMGTDTASNGTLDFYLWQSAGNRFTLISRTDGLVQFPQGIAFNNGTTQATSASTTAVGGDLNGTVANAQLNASSVGNAELAAGAVTFDKVASSTLRDQNILNGGITATKFQHLFFWTAGYTGTTGSASWEGHNAAQFGVSQGSGWGGGLTTNYIYCPWGGWYFVTFYIGAGADNYTWYIGPAIYRNSDDAFLRWGVQSMGDGVEWGGLYSASSPAIGNFLVQINAGERYRTIIRSPSGVQTYTNWYQTIEFRGT